MSLERESTNDLVEALHVLARGFAQLPPFEAAPLDARARAVLREAAERLQDNFPYFHPLYAGQMLKPPHPLARTAAALADWINPNNHALDGGRASSRMEKEAVAEIARMFGWDEHLGHLASGGTMANLEALWIAGRLGPGKRVVASRQAHYTHQRISAVLGIEFTAIDCDRRGRMDLASLERELARGDDRKEELRLFFTEPRLLRQRGNVGVLRLPVRTQGAPLGLRRPESHHAERPHHVFADLRADPVRRIGREPAIPLGVELRCGLE